MKKNILKIALSALLVMVVLVLRVTLLTLLPVSLLAMVVAVAVHRPVIHQMRQSVLV